MDREVMLDANESVFFKRQLEFIKTKTYDVKYPELKLADGRLIPISSEAGMAAESITYRQFDQQGMAKLIANYADDLPRSDVSGKEFTASVKSLGASYAYNIQEIRAGAKAQINLPERRANAARRAIMQLRNKIAFSGDSTANIPGFFTNPNIINHSIPADGTGSNTEFSTKTPDQIIRDLNSIATTIHSTTKGVESPDTLLLPITQYNYLVNTPRSATTDTSILKWYLGNNPFITQVEWLNELTGAGAGSSDVMIAYRRDPQYLTLEIPQQFEQFPVQEHNLEFKVPCHERIAGVLIYFPLSIAKVEGI